MNFRKRIWAFIILITGLSFLLYLNFMKAQPAESLSADAVITHIQVEKSLRKMHVFSGDSLLKTYDISLGFSPEGHKEMEGDGKTPEGTYYITDKNPNSAYHRNLGISYPNDQDRKAAAKLGKSPGGDIKIHGLPNGKGAFGKAHLLQDWTHGCIAVTNEEIEELILLVSIGTQIEILP